MSYKKDAARGLIGPTIRYLNNWFSKNPAKLTDAISALKMPTGSTLTAMLHKIRENPFSSLFTLYSVGEFGSMMLELYQENPALAQLMEAYVPADDVLSLLNPSVLAKKVDDISTTVALVNSLTLAQVEEFEDERQLIKRVLARMPGSTAEARNIQMHEFRKVMNAPASTFAIFDRIEALGAK